MTRQRDHKRLLRRVFWNFKRRPRTRTESIADLLKWAKSTRDEKDKSIAGIKVVDGSGEGVRRSRDMRSEVQAANEAKKAPESSWVQLSPYGQFPNPAGLQTVNKSDAEAMVKEFKGFLNTPQRKMGLPWYIGHPDHPAFKETYKDQRAFGRVKALEARDTGLYGNVAWNEEGRKLLEQEAFNGHSVNWRMKKIGTEWHPFSLKSVGFTNEPAIPVEPVMLNEEQVECETFQFQANSLNYHHVNMNTTTANTFEGHAGRPGHVGGSLPMEASSADDHAAYADAHAGHANHSARAAEAAVRHAEGNDTDQATYNKVVEHADRANAHADMARVASIKAARAARKGDTEAAEKHSGEAAKNSALAAHHARRATFHSGKDAGNETAALPGSPIPGAAGVATNAALTVQSGKYAGIPVHLAKAMGVCPEAEDTANEKALSDYIAAHDKLASDHADLQKSHETLKAAHALTAKALAANEEAIKTAQSANEAMIIDATALFRAERAARINLLVDRGMKDGKIPPCDKVTWETAFANEFDATAIRLEAARAKLHTTSFTGNLGNRSSVVLATQSVANEIQALVREKTAKGATYDDAWSEVKREKPDLFKALAGK